MSENFLVLIFFLANNYFYIYWFDSILTFWLFLNYSSNCTDIQSSEAKEAENELLPPRQTTPKWSS